MQNTAKPAPAKDASAKDTKTTPKTDIVPDVATREKKAPVKVEAKDIIKDTGIVIAQKLAISSIRNISGATLTKINQAVGFRLLTKFGSKGAINLGKAVPLLGGIVGATFDSVTTNTVGNIARDLFIGHSQRAESETSGETSVLPIE